MLIPWSETFHDSLLPTEWHINSLIFFTTQCNMGSSNGPVLSLISHLHLYSTITIVNHLIFPTHSLFFLTFPHLLRLLLSLKCFSSLVLSMLVFPQNNIYLFHVWHALVFSILVYFTLFLFYFSFLNKQVVTYQSDFTAH